MTFENGTANNSAVITVNGSVAELDAALSGLVYTPNLNFTGTDTLSATDVNSVDNLTGTNSTAISVVEPPPAVAAPSTASVNENSLLQLSGANGVTVTDAGPGAEQLTLSVHNGVLTLGTSTGLTVTGNDSTVLTLAGSLSSLNRDLTSLTYVPNSGFYGSDTLAISDMDTSDNLSAATAVGITIAPLPPQIAVPLSVAVSDNAFSFNGSNSISVTDPAASGQTTEQLTLTAGNGTLNVGTTAGLTTVSGLGTGSVELVGPLSSLDSALASLTYTPAAGYTTGDTIKLVDANSSDNLSSTTSITVVNVAPTVSVPTSAIVGEDTSLTFSSGTPSAIATRRSLGCPRIPDVTGEPGDADFRFEQRPFVQQWHDQWCRIDCGDGDAREPECRTRRTELYAQLGVCRFRQTVVDAHKYERRPEQSGEHPLNRVCSAGGFGRDQPEHDPGVCCHTQGSSDVHEHSGTGTVDRVAGGRRRRNGHVC